jgi:hypothetical protein
MPKIYTIFANFFILGTRISAQSVSSVFLWLLSIVNYQLSIKYGGIS